MFARRSDDIMTLQKDTGCSMNFNLEKLPNDQSPFPAQENRPPHTFKRFLVWLSKDAMYINHETSLALNPIVRDKGTILIFSTILAISTGKYKPINMHKIYIGI